MPGDMADKLIESDRAAECMGAHLFRYALGRTETKGDTCELQQLATAMNESSGSLQEMILQMVLSTSFRYRPAQQGME